MKIIELHILQSFPISCLNRDDVGSPKTAVFGGAQRARISSQCLKRATRLLASEQAPTSFQGIRSRFLFQPFKEALLVEGMNEEEAQKNANELCEIFSKPDSKKKDQVTTAVYLSPLEIKTNSKAIAEGSDAKKASKTAQRLDAADIALFGRMVANDASLNIEGAAMFSHALSTHKSTNDIDFFTAVDDRKKESEDAGAGMMGTLEFTSATYYRYAAVNLDLLFKGSHIGKLETQERKSILDVFIRSTLMAVPGARKNSMNAATLPFEVLGIYKEKGQPLQLINAFEKPVTSQAQGFSSVSVEAMKSQLELLKRVWSLEHREELWLSEIGIQTFTSTLTQYVE